MRTATFSQIEVASGALVDLLLPDIEDVRIHDVATALAGTCRFAGNVRPFYSTAQHSCVVASFLEEEDRIHGLLHDAPEYVLGDMPGPAKCALNFICADFKRAYRFLERQVERAIYEAAGARLPTDEQRARVKRADLIALATEQRDVMRSPNFWSLPHPPSNRKIVPVVADDARLMFLDALHECGVLDTLARAA